MPAAPATPPVPPTGGDVIHLDHRRPSGRGGPRIPAGGGNAAIAPDEPSPDPLTGLAHTLQALYAAHGRTLTDEDTAQAYRLALDAVALMLQGALARGHLDPGQHMEIHALLEGMRTAITLL